MEKLSEQLNNEEPKREEMPFNGEGKERMESYYAEEDDRGDDKENSPARLDAALARLSSIAQIVGGDFEMKVRIGETGKGSFFNPDDCSITLDPAHILENEMMADFVTGHEGSHRAITRLATKFGYTCEQIKEMYGRIGFGYMHNAIEDPAVNDWMQGRYVGFRDITHEAYDKQFKEENAVLTTPEVGEIARRLGYWPKFAHFGSEIIRRWFQARYSASLDPAVEQALKKTEFFSDKNREAIPSPNTRNEGAIVSAAKRRFELNNQYIWPEMQKLVEMDVQLGAAERALEDMLKKEKEREQKRKEAGAENDSQKKDGLEKEIDELNKELERFDELKKNMEQAVNDLTERLKQAQQEQEESDENKEKDGGEESEGMEDEGEAAGEGKESQESGETGESGTDGEKNKSGEQGGGAMTDQKGNAGGTSKGKGVEKSETQNVPAPFSKDEEKFLKEIYDSLPQEIRKKYEEETRMALEDLEDALNKELQGKLSDEQPQTHAKQREEREEQARTAARETRKEELDNEVREKLERTRREQMTAYERIREKSKPIADYLYRHLMRVLHPEEWGGEETELPWGEKIEMVRVAQAQADFRQKLKLWIRDIEPERRDYRFQFCVDRSGSTSGIIDEEKIGLLAVADALRRLEEHNTDKVTVKHSISSFSDNYKSHKSFKERLTITLAEEISVVNADGGTNTFEAVKQEMDRAFAEGARTGSFVLLFSDGQPNHDIQEELKLLLSDTKKRREQERVHIGLIWIGDGKEEQALKEECAALVAEYGFDFGLAMNAAAGDGKHHFGKELTALIKGIVEETAVL